VKTRTLLILSALTGLAILIAGVAMFIRFNQAESTVGLLAVGQRGQAGDADVVVDAVSTDGTDLIVAVRLAGVDDPDGLAGFRLVAPGSAVGVTGGTCDGLTVASQECTLVFDANGFDGSSRQLIFLRSDQQLRWDVSRDSP
jgi:hypothetical protein